jgi:hypothetical protein
MKRTLLDKTSMRWFLPDPVVGALAGFLLGFLGSANLLFFGIDLPRFVPVAFAVLGALAGCVVGVFRQGPPGRRKMVAWWCAAMAGIAGVVSFLCGFIGPMLLTPDSNQGPLLGIFVTGPLGAIAGAVCGVVIGLMARTRKNPIQLCARSAI